MIVIFYVFKIIRLLFWLKLMAIIWAFPKLRKGRSASWRIQSFCEKQKGFPLLSLTQNLKYLEQIINSKNLFFLCGKLCDLCG